jgi:two-component system, LytTR family, sensor histidine kinase AlgZ
MHPFAARTRRFLLYLLVWVLPLLFLGSGLRAGGLHVADIAVILIPLCLFYAIVCLAPWYTCRFLPLRTASMPRIVGNHLAAAFITGLIWSFMARGIAALAETWMPALPARLATQVPLLFGSGVFLYLLAVTIHYAYFAFESAQDESRRANTAAVLAREAELKALKAQINPHFLFNSLNSVSALTAVDPAGAREMCLKLSDFLRTALRLGEQQNIAFGNELKLAQVYLEVEQVRFGKRLRIEREIDPRTESARVPPLIVQPLVENAVKHGIAGLVDGGTIRITAKIDGALLRVTVENDFDPDSPVPRRTGLGLANIRNRLSARYGENARLDIQKGETRFRAELILPRAE